MKTETVGDPSGAMIREAIEAMAKKGYEQTPESMKALEEYYRNDHALILIGPDGNGKTSFFECLPRSIIILKLQRLGIRSPREIESLLESLKDDEVLLDDVAAEKQGNDYGTKFDAFPLALEIRMESRQRTHFTTNVETEGLLQRYGARVVDRIHGMAVAVRFKGKSRRSPRVFPKIVPITYDWILCRERCKNCTGDGCKRGVKVPPEHYGRPPEDGCAHFNPIEQRDEGQLPDFGKLLA